MDLRLGDSANLLRGLWPTWITPGCDQRPFFKSPRAAFTTFDMVPRPEYAGEWTGPSFSLHDTVDDLVDGIFDYHIAASCSGARKTEVRPSKLMLADDAREASLDRLGALLGLNLKESPGHGFILLKMSRTAGQFCHEVSKGGIGQSIRIWNYWTAEGRHAMGRLRVAQKAYLGALRESAFTSRQASRYLDYFESFGTHYVSRIVMGDLLVQVLGCDARRFGELKNHVIQETGGTHCCGPLTGGMRIFTGPDWITETGKIVRASCASGENSFPKSDEWFDAEFAKADSLLMLMDRSKRSRLQSALPNIHVPILIEFSSQHSFMEVFRADAFHQVLTGALLQRFPSGIRVSTTSSRVLHDLCDLTPDAGDVETVFDRTSIVKRSVDFSECRLSPRTELQSIDVGCLSFQLSQPFTLIPAQRLAICAFHTSIPFQDEIPVLRLTDHALDNFSLITAKMNGVLFLTNSSGTRRDTILNGLRLKTQRTDEGASRVIAIENNSVPSPESLELLQQGFWDMLLYAEAILLMPSVIPDPTRAHFRQFLNWIAQLLAGSDQHRALRLRAILSSRFTGPLAPLSRFSSPIRLEQESLAQLIVVAQRFDALSKSIRMQLRTYAHQAAFGVSLDPDSLDALHRLAGTVRDSISPLIKCLNMLLVQLGDAADREVQSFACQNQACLVDYRSMLNSLSIQSQSETSRSPCHSILAALSELLSQEQAPISQTLPGSADDPEIEFWGIVSRIQIAGAAADSLDQWNACELTERRRIEEGSIFAAENPVYPSQSDWSRLAELASSLLASAAGNVNQGHVCAVLKNYVQSAGDWCHARLRRGRLKLLQETLTEFQSPSTGVSAVNELNTENCHAANLLALAWRLLDDSGAAVPHSSPEHLTLEHLAQLVTACCRQALINTEQEHLDLS